MPVAIWVDDTGVTHCRMGIRDNHRNLDLDAALTRWPFIFPNVVARDDYTVAWTTGVWPDGTPTVSPDAAPAAGDNLPSDPFERLKAEIDDKLGSATTFLNDAAAKPDKLRADRARNIQAELLALIKSADTMHETEKAPHLAAGRAVDAKFRFRDQVKEACVRLRTVFENIAKRLEAEANEAARRAHAEQMRKAEEERQRIEAERQKKLADDPVAALTDPEPELPMVPAAPEPVKVQVGGGVGRAAGLKTVWEPRIDDWKKAAMQFVASDDPDIRAAVEKKIKAIARLNKDATKIDGVSMVADRRAA